MSDPCPQCSTELDPEEQVLRKGLAYLGGRKAVIQES